MIATSHRTPAAGVARHAMRVAAAAFAALAVLLVLPPAARAQVALAPSAAASGVRLVSSDATGVTFEVDVPEPRLSGVEAPNGRWQQLEIAGYGADARAGAPLLPAATVWLATPPGATVTVRADGEGERVFEGVRLLPQQELPRAADARAAAAAPQGAVPAAGVLGRDLVEDPAAYARGSLSAPGATFEGIAHLRAQRVARIALRPAAYDARAGRVRVWSRLRVRVDFAGAQTAAAGPGPAAASDAFESIYAGTLLNYESGRAWRRDLQAGSLRRLGLQPNTARPAAGAPAGLLGGARQDFSASTNWVKLTVPTKGMYRVEASDFVLAGANLGTLDPRTIRVFVKPGLPLLDEKEAPSGWLSEVAIDVVGESDGRFDTSDYVVFYGLGVSGWRDDYGVPGSEDGWLNHPYETRNTYWLTWDAAFVSPPRRWSSRSGAPDLAGAFETPDFPARVHYENDFFYVPDLQEGFKFHAYTGVFWEKWCWLKIADNSGVVQLGANAPGAVAGRPARLRARLWGNSDQVGGLLADHYLNVSFDIASTLAFPERAFNGFTRQDYDTTFIGLAETGNRLSVFCRDVDPEPAELAPGRGRAVLVRPRLREAPPPDEQPARLPQPRHDRGRGLRNGSVLADHRVRPARHVRSARPAAHHGIRGARHHRGQGDLLPRRRRVAASLPGLHRVEPASPRGDPARRHRRPGGALERRRLRGAGVRRLHRAGAAPGAASRHGAVGRGEPAHPGGPDLRCLRLVLGGPHRSGGHPQLRLRRGEERRLVAGAELPVPVRRRLVRLQGHPARGPARPAAVARADVRQRLPVAPVHDRRLAGGPRPGGERTLPGRAAGPVRLGLLRPAGPRRRAACRCRTRPRPRSWSTRRSFPTTQDPTWGEWRERVLLLADDTVQGDKPDPLSGTHTQQSETISRGYLPDVVEQRKIYMVRYPFGAGTEKPTVNRDVKATVNEGVLLWNYIGHGNPFKMADENAFILSDVSSLVNLDKPTFLVAASCDLGKFDDPSTTGLGESLLKSTAGGAIAAFSASDLAFAFANAALSQALFLDVFEEFPEGFTRTLGSAVLAAKMRLYSSVNDLKYTLMGDPGQRLALPDHQVRLAITDAETDAPLDSLRRGRLVRVRGEVHGSHDPNVSDLLDTYSGVAALLVTDSPPARHAART